MRVNIIIILLFLFLAPTVRAETLLHQKPTNFIDKKYLEFQHTGTNNDHQQIINNLTELLHSNPDNISARLDLAIEYYNIYEYDLALEQLNLVLESRTLPPLVEKNINEFRNRIINQKYSNTLLRDKFKGRFKIIYGYDSNANASPSDAELDIGILHPSKLAKSDEFAGASLLLFKNYQYPGSYKFNDKSLNLSWKSSLKITTKDYKTVNTSDLNIIRLDSGLYFRESLFWNTGLKLKFEYFNLADKNYANFYTINPRLTFNFGHSLLTVSPFYTYRSYYKKLDKRKEGNQYNAEILYKKHDFFGMKLHLGLVVKSRKLNAKYLSHSGQKISFVLSKILLPWLSVHFKNSYEYSKYEDLEVFYRTKRKDEIFRSQMSLNYKLSKNILMTFKGSYYKRSSNHDIHSYDRYQVEANIGYKF